MTNTKDIKQETLHTWATDVSKKKQEDYETKKRKKMEKYRRACKRAALKGKFSKTFRAGYGILHTVSPLEFQCYFSFDKAFELDIKKGKVTVKW